MKNFLRKRSVQHIGWIALLLILWQILYLSGTISPLLLPGVEDVFLSLTSSLFSGVLFSQILLSLEVILLGLIIALFFAVAIAALSLRSKIIKSLSDTLSMLAHPLPAVAVLPLIIVWFGVGTQAIVIVIVHSVLWPMLVNLTAGFHSVRKVYIYTGCSLSFTPLEQLIYVYIPAGTAAFISGIRIGWARAWRALISAEMIFGAIGGSGGIGWAMFKSRVMMDTAGLFSGILVVIIIGIAAEALINLLERKTLMRWGVR